MAGRLKVGERLPSSRAIAAALGLARGTVVEAFSQLIAEGYLVSQTGKGTCVAAIDNEQTPVLQRQSEQSAEQDERLTPAMERLAAISRQLAPLPPVPFAVAVPGAGIAPDDMWRRLGNRVRASARAAPATYADPRGEPELREAIADYVRRARAVDCGPQNVIVTSGTQQGLYMTGRVLLSAGDRVWTEDPAYPGLTAVLDDMGVVAHRVAPDAQGMNVEQALAACGGARAAFVTPSHQYPVGMPLSMARRLALVAWAREKRAWIVEDDYDSELRYSGHPFPAMQGLAPTRVIYLGTFSKVLFPSLRLGYVIAPEPLVEAFAGARAILDRHSPTADQHVLAAYMKEGFFDAHVRRIRNLYAERRAVLLDALATRLPKGCVLQPSDQGMHLLLWLPDGADDQAISTQSLKAGLAVRAISPMYAKGGRPGLMLGFGGFTTEQLLHATGQFLGVLGRYL